MTKLKKLSLLFLFFGAFNCCAQTSDEDIIDLEYHACLIKDTSSANIDQCAYLAYGKWYKEMNKAYDKLLKTLKKDDDRKALKQAQDAWVAYRLAEFTSYDGMFNRPGSTWCLLRQDSRIDMVRARTLQLRNYEEAIRQNKSEPLFRLRSKPKEAKAVKEVK